MLKKIILMAVSAAALLAFTASAANASGALITTAEGNVADTITGVSSNTTTVTSVGTLECATVSLHGNIQENANTTAIGSGTGMALGTVGKEPHTSHCGSSSGAAVHIDSITITSIHLTRHGAPISTTGTANFDYTYRLTTIFGTAHCTFTGVAVPVKKTGTDTINVNGNLTGHGSFPCPTTGTINGDFTVLDKKGEPVHIH